MSRLGNILNALASYEKRTVATGITATKRGKVVTVSFVGPNTTSTSVRTTFGTLPTGWWPAADVFVGNISGNAGYVGVNASGEVQAFRPTLGRVDATVTYVV